MLCFAVVVTKALAAAWARNTPVELNASPSTIHQRLLSNVSKDPHSPSTPATSTRCAGGRAPASLPAIGVTTRARRNTA
ncbi:hypothetical protein D3C85_1600590 [compost metagenome]